MTWDYKQPTGELSHNDSTWIGYSGTGDGRNNPFFQNQANVGPIPVGQYKIGPDYDDPHLGLCVMHLDPVNDTNTFGRTLFRIHGDNAEHDASHGCIIMGPAIRSLIAASDDRILVVTA